MNLMDLMLLLYLYKFDKFVQFDCYDSSFASEFILGKTDTCGITIANCISKEET